MNSKLVLGTVQFGLDYGIAGGQQVPVEEVQRILDFAQENGISTLDTAITYGNSEQLLGETGVQDWQIVTKLPSIPHKCTDVERWVQESVQGSLQRLKVSQLYGLILHRPADLNDLHGKILYRSLKQCETLGWVGKLGVSIYEPEELAQLPAWFSPKLVQAPFNVLDQRLFISGLLDRLHQQKVEIHVRSLFLQGLLLMTSSQLPSKFQRWTSLWQYWHQWLHNEKISAVQACIQFALKFPYINGMVVGVGDAGQLQQIIAATQSPFTGEFPPEMVSNDLDLINPSNWKSL